MATERLSDTWTHRDLPVLVAVAGLLEETGRIVRVAEVAKRSGLDNDAVISAMSALDGPYLVGKPMDTFGGRIDYLAKAITERGRRTVGLWPDDSETADALLSLLREAENSVDDPEEKNLIRRAGGALGSISKDVLADVLAAYVRSQVGA